MHVYHGGCFRVRFVLLHLFGCEFRPRVQETFFDVLSPSGDDWQEESDMIESYAVLEMRNICCIRGLWSNNIDRLLRCIWNE